MKDRRAGFKLIEVAIAIIAVCLLMSIALPNYIKTKQRGLEAEVKLNLHEIQLHLERFAVDSGGNYPAYLIGGSPGNLTEQTSDSLLRKGYLKSYPKNPFYRTEASEVLDYQKLLPDSLDYPSDPLMPGAQSAAAVGCRFGLDGTRMGNVLADPRYTSWVRVDASTTKTQVFPTYVDVEYDFWDTEQRRGRTNEYLPGEFFYKGSGPIVVQQGEDAGYPLRLPREVDTYILGAYGSLKNPGKDVLGPEKLILYWSSKQPPVTSLVWPWTRSQVGDPTRLEGSPFRPADVQETHEQLWPANPNGIKDSVILVIESGTHYLRPDEVLIP
jgi:type II secretory pathway pseudopilin PulG